MSDEQQVWERQEEEPNLWYDRFMSYLQMGPSRSLLGTVHAEEARNSKEKQSSSPPGAWSEAFKQWKWKERAEAYDDYRRKQVFTQGNAYDVYRTERLNHYSQRLEQELDKMLNALPKKPKKPWFNHFLYEKYLQTLEALAAETGGRVKRSETNLTFPPEIYKGITPQDEGSEP